MIILVNKESARHQYGNYKIHDDLRQRERERERDDDPREQRKCSASIWKLYIKFMMISGSWNRPLGPTLYYKVG
jgi:hypothetical protein